MYNIVTKYSIIEDLKKSKYYKQNLGLVTTLEHNGARRYNESDKFSYYYNTTYKTNIQMKGNIGDIVVYQDYYINEDVVAIYFNQEEFIYQYDKDIVKNKGMDFYLGHLLRKVEEEKQERIKVSEIKKIEVKKEGDPEALLKNPGMVTYEDLKAYLAEKNKNRF